MAVYRVERTRNYTVMGNFHLKDANLSLKAKGLLSIMLSLPDEWNYSTRGLAAICKEGVYAVGNILKELEQAGYIIRRQIRGANGRICDTEYTIYEQAQTQAPDTVSPVADSPDTDSPDVDSSDVDSPNTDLPNMGNRPELNINKSNTQKENTYQSNTHSFCPPYPPSSPLPAVRTEGMTEVNAKRAEIWEQIDYARFAGDFDRGQVDEFVEIMLEVAFCHSPTIKIGRGQEYPTALVQQRFERIDSTHIEKVLDGIRENTTRIWNTRAYLLAALFNAPATTDNHYSMLVNHDLYSSE